LAKFGKIAKCCQSSQSTKSNEKVMREFFDMVLALVDWNRLVSHEHFTVDGTLIEALMVIWVAVLMG
jgi:hypothetical protein